MTKLEAMRRKAGWSQTRLAAAARLQASDISRYERGWAKPFPKQAARLAKLLGLAAEELLEPASHSVLDGDSTLDLS